MNVGLFLLTKIFIIELQRLLSKVFKFYCGKIPLDPTMYLRYGWKMMDIEVTGTGDHNSANLLSRVQGLVMKKNRGYIKRFVQDV